MKLVTQITVAIVAAAILLFVGSAVLVGSMDAASCMKHYTAAECRAKL